MNTWETFKLGDLINIKHGYAFSGDNIINYNNNIVLVTPGNFKIGGGFQEEKCKYFNGKIPEEYILKTNDLIITMTDLSKNIDTLGYSALIPKNEQRVYLHNQRIGLVSITSQKITKQFAYYLLQTHNYQRTVAGTSTGATVHHTSPSKIYDVKVRIPKIELQNKITTILCNYDDLIENNKKQIKLLEEAAEKLYKEWFIKLNYQNHENEEIIDGIPRSWHKGILNDITEFNRGKIITKDSAITGRIPVIAGGLEPAYYHNTSNTQKPVITISGSGANAGYTKLHFKKIWASDCSFVDISNCKYLYFVYCFLKKSKAYIDNLKKGAAQPHVYPKDINNLEMLIPSETILNNFTGIITPYFDKIGILRKQILLLQEARDKLLPKLMNGSIEI